LTICIDPPPTSFLNLTSARSGSMPVVSQSIIRPMVPVGASTEACALRQPLRAPIARHSCQAAVARSWMALLAGNVRTSSLAAACLRITRWWDAALRA
jgi:hypothetical protein